MKTKGISFFHKYLTLWVILCMIGGVVVGSLLPQVPQFLNQFEFANVSLISAVLIWIMIFPMMMKVDFTSVKRISQNPKGLYLTWIINWLVKPFSMYLIAGFFFYYVFQAILPADIAREYLAGAVILGAAPCTAMVFVWSELTDGDPAYTVVQVATNNLILLVAFVPIVKFLLGVEEVFVPWDTLILSVILFVLIPLIAGYLTRKFVIQNKGKKYFNTQFVTKFDGITTVGLLLMLIYIFATQANTLVSHFTHILLIAVPLTIQTFVIFGLSCTIAKFLKLPYVIAAPAGMIGASNFFELALAVAIALFGVHSPVALATTVGVLTEVPLMLFLVKFANSTKDQFPTKYQPARKEISNELRETK